MNMRLIAATKELKRLQALSDGNEYYIAMDFYSKKYRIEIRSKSESLKLDKDPINNQKITDFVNNYDITKDLH